MPDMVNLWVGLGWGVKTRYMWPNYYIIELVVRLAGAASIRRQGSDISAAQI